MDINEWTLPEPAAEIHVDVFQPEGRRHALDCEANAPFGHGSHNLFTAEQMREAYAAGQRAAKADDSEICEVIKERDTVEEVLDAVLDEVLGIDREEWSSGYGYASALDDVQERMAGLTKEGQRAAVPEGGEVERLRAEVERLMEGMKSSLNWEREANDLLTDQCKRVEAAESQRDMLAEAIRQYELEMLNPGPDYVMRHQRRKEMFEARARVSQPPAKAPADAAQERDDA